MNKAGNTTTLPRRLATLAPGILLFAVATGCGLDERLDQR